MRFRSPGNPVRDSSDHLFLAYMSHNFRNAVLNGLAKRLKPLGVTPVQMAIVLRCHTGDAATVTELARIIPLSVALISRQVEQLVKMGLLTRKPTEDDRRVAHLSLTEKAEEMVPDFPAPPLGKRGCAAGRRQQRGTGDLGCHRRENSNQRRKSAGLTIPGIRWKPPCPTLTATPGWLGRGFLWTNLIPYGPNNQALLIVTLSGAKGLKSFGESGIG